MDDEEGEIASFSNFSLAAAHFLLAVENESKSSPVLSLLMLEAEDMEDTSPVPETLPVMMLSLPDVK